MDSHVCCKRRTGPRRLDAHQMGKIKESSLARYRTAVLPFIKFLRRCGISPHGAEQWDDMLVEWKNACVVARSQFEQALAGVEFFSHASRVICAGLTQWLPAGASFIFLDIPFLWGGAKPASLLPTWPLMVTQSSVLASSCSGRWG